MVRATRAAVSRIDLRPLRGREDLVQVAIAAEGARPDVDEGDAAVGDSGSKGGCRPLIFTAFRRAGQLLFESAQAVEDLKYSSQRVAGSSDAYRAGNSIPADAHDPRPARRKQTSHWSKTPSTRQEH